MSASGTLNLANYTTVWSDNFAGDSSLNTNLWPVAWGNGDDFAFGNGGLTLTSYAAEGWSAVGFMQADNSPAAAQGYGLYSATFSADAGQGAGICIVMWPANNVWPGAEIDLTEDWSNTDRQSGNATIHWAGAGDSNQYQTYSYSANMTQPTTVAMDWEPGSLTFYVNGQQAFQYTGAQVPLDAAQGGVNESFGAEVTAAGDAPVSASVSLNLYSMSYSTYNGGASTGSSTTAAGGTTSGSTGAGSGTSSTTPGTTIAVSNPGTVQEASPGAGVNVTETISDPGLSTAYVMVMTSANVGEANWQAVSLNAAGTGSYTAHFANTGDYLLAVDNTGNPTDEGWSNPVTITDPTTVGATTSGEGTSTGSASTGGGTTTGTTTSGGGTSDPAAITLTGDNLAAGSPAWTTIGTLSTTDANAVTYATGANPDGMFSIDGDKLLLNTALPADPAASYQVGIIAVDSTGAMVTQTLTVDVATPTAPGTGTGSTTTGTTTTGGGTATGSTTTGDGSPTGSTSTGGGTTTGTTTSGGGTSDPAAITLTGDNLAAGSPAWTTIGTLSTTDANAVTYATGANPDGMFSIDGDKLLLNTALPADPAASYQVGIIAVDSTGAMVTQTLTVGVESAASSGATTTGSGTTTGGGTTTGSGTTTGGGATTGGGTATGSGTTTGGGATTGGGTSGAAAITLTGDNLAAGSPAWTTIGTLSTTDANAVTYATGANPDGMFSIDGDKLLLNTALPADPAASYQVGIIAVDSTGAMVTQTLTVDVTSAVAAPTAAVAAGVAGNAAVSISATDAAGDTAALGLGAQTFAAGTTGLSGAVTETTAGGTTTFATAAGSGVTGLTIADSTGGSYQTSGFADVTAALSGASAGSLVINDAASAKVSLGSGNYDVQVSSRISTATVQLDGGSGTDQFTFVGPGPASFVAGSGSTVIFGGSGDNSVTFGTGTAQVHGGSGADTYTFHAGDGLQDIETFSAAKGDVLDVDSSLKGSLHESAAGGGTLLSFGSAAHGILLQGVSSFDTAQIHWI